MGYKYLFNLQARQDVTTAMMVNHSGEIGAKQIYLGQIAASKTTKQTQETINELIKMLESEVEHYEYFANQINSSVIFKPSAFDVIWKPFSFCLGYISAFASPQIAMLLTKQVETVIEEHYKQQIQHLKQCNEEGEVIAKIHKFLLDELEHKHIGEQKSAEISKHLKQILELVFSFIVSSAIFISSRV